MATIVRMPELGESVTEGTITRWLKAEGDTVAVDEPLVEVSTDKVDTEIPSPAAGVLVRIVAAEDDTVEVGGDLAVIGSRNESGSRGSGEVWSDGPRPYRSTGQVSDRQRDRTAGKARVDATPQPGWYEHEGGDGRWYWNGAAWTAHRSAPFSVFLSYTRDERETVTALRQDIERLRIPVWYDDQLHGGEQWWQRILDEIVSCGAVVYAVSDRSLDSEFCRLEVAWARMLGISVLPVQVGDVANPRTHEITSTQLIDYRKRGADQAIQLAVSLAEAQRSRRPLPDPLPSPIAMPYAGLAAVRSKLQSHELGLREQRDILSTLDEQLGTATPTDVRKDIASLLSLLCQRDDVVLRVARDAERLMQECNCPPADGRE